MISKHILWITFLNEPELIFSLTVKIVSLISISFDGWLFIFLQHINPFLVI